MTLTPAGAALAVTPTYNASQSFWHVTHSPGGPGGTTHQVLNQALQNTSSPSITYDHTTTFKTSTDPDGTTRAKAGVGRTQGSTNAKLVFPSGLGIDQIDPAPASQSGSTVTVDFKAVWDISGTFGPSILGTFSVPYGAKVGTGGSALFECDVKWETRVNSGAITTARTAYIVSQPFGTGTHLTSFTAPSATFSPSSMSNTAGIDQIICRGFVKFTVNNDDEPTYSSFPRQGTGPDEFIPQNPTEEEILNMVPQTGFDDPTPPPALYWDVNGSAPGSGGPAPSGAWDGVTANFTDDASGGGVAQSGTTLNDVINFSAGSDATGTYNVTVAGTRAASEIVVEEGSVNLQGGAVVLEAISVVSGANSTVFSQVNPAAVTTNGVVKYGGGTVTFAAANNYTGGTVVSDGTLQVNRLHENNAVTITGGTLKVLPSAPTLPHPSGNNASVSRPSSLTIDHDNAALGARVYFGTLDLGNNDLILDYTGASPIAHIEDMVRSGYNLVGDWLGTGITSSIAQLDGNYVIAVADNATLAAPFGTAQGGPLFAGVDVDLDTILVKFTHRADINLDGLVTPDDSATFGGAYDEGQPATWATGDMNFDGIHSPDDAAIFGGYYDESLASLPEPGGLAAMGVLVAVATRRRSRVGQ